MHFVGRVDQRGEGNIVGRFDFQRVHFRVEPIQEAEQHAEAFLRGEREVLHGKHALAVSHELFKMQAGDGCVGVVQRVGVFVSGVGLAARPRGQLLFVARDGEIIAGDERVEDRLQEGTVVLRLKQTRLHLTGVGLQQTNRQGVRFLAHGQLVAEFAVERVVERIQAGEDASMRPLAREQLAGDRAHGAAEAIGGMRRDAADAGKGHERAVKVHHQPVGKHAAHQLSVLGERAVSNDFIGACFKFLPHFLHIYDGLIADAP